MEEHLIEFVTEAMRCAIAQRKELRLGDEDSGLLRCGYGYWDPTLVLWMDGGDSEGREVTVEVGVENFLKSHKVKGDPT